MRAFEVIENIIFDLDGTLIDSCAICVSILQRMLADRGVERAIDPIWARRFMSRGGQTMIAALLGPDCGDPAAELAEFRLRYAEFATPEEALFPHVSQSIAQLSNQGMRLAVCSNKPQNLCEKSLRDTGLSPYFDTIVGSTTGLRPKPESDMLERVLEDLGCAPQHCVYVGDSEVDHAAAQGSGVPFLFVEYGYRAEGWAPDGCESFDCFKALTRSILSRTTNAHA